MEQDLYKLAAGALVLGFLHALIPNHWVPFVLMGRNRGWGTGRTTFVAFLGGSAHLASTILVGVAIGLLGLALSDWHESIVRWGAPVILIAAGIWILARGHAHSHHDALHPHDHDHGHDHDRSHGSGSHLLASSDHLNAQDLATVGALCAMMFLSPCLEMEAYYVVAAQKGWVGIGVVSAVYFVVTVPVMVGAVAAASKGLERLRWQLLERHEGKLTGGALILLGIVWMLLAH